MAGRFQAPRGTFDVLPPESARRARIHAAAADLFTRAGYGRIETPNFEDTELFARSVGEATDIVRKEMFTFEDLGGRSVTLRPEATAAICRAYVEHGMHKLAQPVKLWSSGPFFRYEAPQAGRFRQFHQLDVEAIGSDSPLVDAEQVVLLDELLRGLGVGALRLRLSSLGSPESRKEYRAELREYLRAHEDELSKEVRERIDANPMRAFDSDDEGTQAVMAEAPRMIDRLSDEDADHFAEVRGHLDRAGVDYELDGTLVRGLDYYTRTVFEFESDRLGAQSELGGGGRYDGLVAELGGPEAPGCGWAAGIERILLAIGDEDEKVTTDVFIAAADVPARARAGARARAPERRALGRPRPRRPQPQGPDEAGRPHRRSEDGDPRRGRQGAAARHGDRRAARGRSGEALPGARMSEFPALRANAYRDAWCGQVLPEKVGQAARVAGWVHRRRDHGGLIFIDLRDRTGLVQLVFDPDESAEANELAHKLRAEDVLSAAGEVVRRDPETVNPALPTGEVELRVTDAELLADAETPPFEIEGFSGEVGEETRLRHRYLDLRREPMQRGDRAARPRRAAMREFLDAEGFLEIETPDADPLDPRGGARLPRPEPPPAGLLLRAAAVAAALQAAADGRRLRALLPDRPLLPRRGDARRPPGRVHPARRRDVVRRRSRTCSTSNERLLAHVFERVGGPKIELPLERLPYDEAIERFGTDRPDIRFGLELVDLSDALRETEFKVFRSVIDSGGAVRGLNAGKRDAAALGPRRADLTGPGARRQGPRLGLPRGRRLALADGEVPLRGRAARR